MQMGDTDQETHPRRKTIAKDGRIKNQAQNRGNDAKDEIEPALRYRCWRLKPSLPKAGHGCGVVYAKNFGRQS
jgi:hypothetical protein